MSRLTWKRSLRSFDSSWMETLKLPAAYPQWGTRKRLYGVCVRSVLLSGCQAVSAAVRPLCAVGLSGSCQAVTLGPDSDGTPRLPDSAIRLSDTCCQTVRESAVSAVRLSGTVRRCPGVAVRLSDQGSEAHTQQQRNPIRLICSCALRACWGSRRARMRMGEREIFENQQVHDTLSLDSAYEAKMMEALAA